jgi:hypothetical protein
MEIESLVGRYGADQFMCARDDSQGQAVVQFRIKKRIVRFRLQLLLKNKCRSASAWEQTCRSRWRALLLCIKAKLEAVESGICELDDEFMANIILPDGQTAGEWLKPQIEKAYLSGKMPSTLLALPAPDRS